MVLLGVEAEAELRMPDWREGLLDGINCRLPQGVVGDRARRCAEVLVENYGLVCSY